MEEGIQLPLDYQWSPAMSSIPGLPLKLSYSGDGPVTFDVSADGGSLLLWSDSKITEVGASFQAGNDITLYWTSYFQHNDPQTGESCLETFSGEKTYVDILVRQGEAIVGYAVVEIASDGGTVPLYAATLLKMEGFPGKNGTPSEAEVRAKMEEIKEEARSAA